LIEISNKNKIASLRCCLENKTKPGIENTNIGDIINKPGVSFLTAMSQLNSNLILLELIKSVSNPFIRFPDKDDKKEISSGKLGLYLLDFKINSPNVK
jgi:hypothetical protein